MITDYQIMGVSVKGIEMMVLDVTLSDSQNFYPTKSYCPEYVSTMFDKVLHQKGWLDDSLNPRVKLLHRKITAKTLDGSLHEYLTIYLNDTPSNYIN